jgi:hypothetical protein
MQHNPVIILLLWILCAFLLRNVLRHLLERRFPQWYERRHRDAESVAAAGAFLLSLVGVTAAFYVVALIWPPS